MESEKETHKAERAQNLDDLTMPICEICSENVASESEMKTHLLLSHLENEMQCPLCSLSGVSYDELSFHINSAHVETPSTKMSMKASVPHAKAGTEDREGHCTERLFSKNSSCKTTVPVAEGGTDNAAGSVCDANSRATAHSPEGRALTKNTKDRQESLELHVAMKQKRLSSPKAEKLFPCPLCSLVCRDSFILQEHVELHLQEQAHEGITSDGEASGLAVSSAATSNTSSAVRSYQCPLCPLSFPEAFALQEHVELHLDDGVAASGAASSSSDLRLARQLQEEEEVQRRKQEAKREAEEFKKLQKQFGMDGSGGYRKQIERNMERAVSRGNMGPAEFHQKRAELMESLATGVDDGKTRTQGLMGALYDYFRREPRDTAHVWLCAEADHYSSSEGDKGWGCGYRNFQMLLSSLRKQEPYNNVLTDVAIPNIPRVQALIEEAWKLGVDPAGAAHFNHRLQGTRAWVGTTEIFALFTSLSVNARVVDFHKPTGQGGTHPRLFDWVKQYFTRSTTGSGRLPPRVIQTPMPPIYLQHQGHSRSVVGVEQKRNGSLCLLLFDPGSPPSDMAKLLERDPATVSASVRRMRKFPNHLKSQQYQVLVVEGVLTPEQKQRQIVNSRQFRAERVP